MVAVVVAEVMKQVTVVLQQPLCPNISKVAYKMSFWFKF